MTAQATRTRTSCRRCRKALIIPAGEARSECIDRVRCDQRRTDLSPTERPQAVADDLPEGDSCARSPTTPPVSVPVADPGNADTIADEQKTLAVRAVEITHKLLDKFEDAIDNGVAVFFKDGSSAMQPLQPMAMASMLRELRPVVQEPVRASEQRESFDRPLPAIPVNDPAVVRAVVHALRGMRDRKLLASQTTIETSAETNISQADVSAPNISQAVQPSIPAQDGSNE